MHHNSYELLRRFALSYFQPGLRVLEVGPDPHGLAKALVERAGVVYHFADLAPGPSAVERNEFRSAEDERNEFRSTTRRQVGMRGEYRFDCPDGAFDIVFSANVIEHVRKVWRWMAELARITKPGGLVVCVNPVSWPYHEAPVDCWRLLPEAYQALFEEAGLEHVLSWHGNLVPIDACWAAQHGPQPVTDTVAIGRKPGGPP